MAEMWSNLGRPSLIGIDLSMVRYSGPKSVNSAPDNVMFMIRGGGRLALIYGKHSERFKLATIYKGDHARLQDYVNESQLVSFILKKFKMTKANCLSFGALLLQINEEQLLTLASMPGNDKHLELITEDNTGIVKESDTGELLIGVKIK